MSSAETPAAVRDLSAAEQRGPAEQEEVRGPPTGGGSAYYQDTVRLPGFGFAPDRCRSLQPVGFCEHGHVALGRSSCGTRRCPDHWRDWTERAVVNAVARLAAYRYVQQGAGKRLLHVVASPEQDRRWTADAFWDARSASYDAAEAAGARGGVAVPHPYRASDDGEHLWEAATEHGDWEEERGKWSLFRDDAGDDWGRMREHVEAAPHYHMLAPARDLDGDDAPAGWVVKNIRSLPRFHVDDVEAYRAMARPMYYLLTHAAAQDGRNTVTYWGDVHPGAFNPEEELSAARWERIQEYAERAVKERPAEGAAGTGSEEQLCERDGCESEIVPIEELGEWLQDETWVRSLGREERLELRGVQVWAQFGDRPPPTSSEAAVREWLRERGRLHHGLLGERAAQVGLGSFA